MDYIPHLDGSSQEAFDLSFTALLEYLRNDSEQMAGCKHVRCLNCRHIQDDQDWYRCENCGHDTGVLIP